MAGDLNKEQEQSLAEAPSDRLLMMDMLAALKVAEKAINDCLTFRSHLNYAALDQVRAAIRKAEGWVA